MKQANVAFGYVKSEVVWCDLDKATLEQIEGIAEVRAFQKGAWLVWIDPRSGMSIMDLQGAIIERTKQLGRAR